MIDEFQIDSLPTLLCPFMLSCVVQYIFCISTILNRTIIDSKLKSPDHKSQIRFRPRSIIVYFDSYDRYRIES